MAEVTMPQLGEAITEGTITRWFKQVGDSVAEDEVLFEVSTDKVDSEVPSPVAGVLTEIRVPEGELAEVGVVLAVVSAEADAAAVPEAEAPVPVAAMPEPAAPEPAAPAPEHAVAALPPEPAVATGAAGAVEITLPALGEAITEGTITRWFKQVGDTVAEDELLYEVSTDKVDSEVPSPASGVLAEIRVPEGELVEVGVVLAVLTADGAAPAAPAPAPEVAGAPAAP
ncbi:MAG: biotin/lipoyl-containing protein, partial [Acidimicrobiales bacterium]